MYDPQNEQMLKHNHNLIPAHRPVSIELSSNELGRIFQFPFFEDYSS